MIFMICFLSGALYVLGLMALARFTKESKKREKEAFESWVSEEYKDKIWKR